MHTPATIADAINASPWIDTTPDDYFKHGTIDGLYLEFGVAQGASIRQIAKVKPDQLIYGFDWFDGLPEPWGLVPKGTFKCAVPKDLPSNVILVSGLFQKTLPDFLREHPGNVAFAHIDSDLYSSAKYVLTSLADRVVDGTLLAFDEIHSESAGKEGHEDRAFAEFLNEHGMIYQCLSHGSHNALFRMVRTT